MTRATKAVFIVTTVAALYLLFNAWMLSSMRIPGLGSAFVLGLLGPLAGIVFTWMYTGRRMPHQFSWYALSGSLSAVYVSVGFFSLFMIVQVWSSV